MANQTYNLPQNLGDLMGAYDEAHWETETLELKTDAGVLKRGSVLSLVAGKLELVAAANQATVYGVLLEASVDTAKKFSDNSVTGSVARAGSFRGGALIVAAGTNAATLKAALRGLGIFVEGPITVPGAAAAAEEQPTATPEHQAPEPSINY